MDTDLNPGAVQPALDPEYETSKLAMDIQARQWARVARRWMWIVALAALTAGAAGAGFYLL